MKFVVYKNDIKLDVFEEKSSNFEILFGRSSLCDIRVDDQRISREHLLFSFNDNILSIKDLTSTNKVLINGISSNQGILANEDLISLFDFSISVTEFLDSDQKQAVELSKTVILNEEERSEAMADSEIESNELTNSVFLEDSINTLEASSIELDQDFSQSVLKETSGNDIVSFEEGEVSDESNTDVVTDFLNYNLKISGPHIETQDFQISKKLIYIGRSRKKCHIVLEDDDVSSIHAKIEVYGKKVFIEDLDSSNGVYLNGDKVQRVQLAKGDEILIGNVSFLLELGSKVLDQESERLMPVNVEDIRYEEASFSQENVAVFSEDEAPQKKSLFSFAKAEGVNKRKVMIYGAMAAMLGFLYLGEDNSSPQGVVKRDIAKEEIEVETPELIENSSIELGAKHSDDDLAYLNQHYELAKAAFKEGIYDQAIYELDLVKSIDSEFKDTTQLLLASQEGLERLEALEKKRIEEEERLKLEEKIKELVAKTKESLKDKNLELVQSYISQIAEIDPEYSEIIIFQREVDLIKKKEAEEKKKEEEKKLAKENFLKILNEVKSLYQEKQYFNAFSKSDNYIKLSSVEGSLYEEGVDLRKEIKEKMDSLENELLEKANTYFQGEDFKNAYESYREVLTVNPTNRLAITKVNLIKDQINSKAMKVYREGLVSESISLHKDAKEKFEEVLRLAPRESHYYVKAKNKLSKFYTEE